MNSQTRYGIFDSDNQQLVEGGFFSRAFADDSCAEWNKSAQDDGAPKHYYVARQNGTQAVRS
jgi:hypothetical protein